MKRVLHFLIATIAVLVAVPIFAHLCGFSLDAGALLAIPLVPAVNLSGIAELFRPDRIAQVINTTENYGTPVLDRFYPESRRRPWDSVLVPVDTISTITRAVPLVMRGAPGVSLTPDSSVVKWIEPQPIKTYDAVGAAELNNAALAGQVSMQQWADDKTRKHLAAHRFTTEALAAQSLSGTITFPIAAATGVIIDTMTVAFGTVGSYTVSADWTAGATTMQAIYKDLQGMRRQLARLGYNGSVVLAGQNVMSALLDKLAAATNDTRTVARQQEDGGIRIGEFVVFGFDAEYYHPGGPGGSPAAGYTKVIGDDEVMMLDPNAPFTLLRVKLDNFKMPADAAPLGIITEVTKDGGAVELFAESKPFPIPVPAAMIRTDATVTA